MRIAVIGCNEGLGLKLSQSFARAGAQVFSTVLPGGPMEEIDRLGANYPNSLISFDMDVTREDQLRAAADFIAGRYGQLDALIHVAGVILPSDRENTIEKTDLDALRKTLEVNLIGVVGAIKHFSPLMAQGAPFVVITSEGCDIGQCGTWIPAYALSKCAATKAVGIARQSVKGPRFFAMHPGRMNTRLGRATAQIEPEEAAASICHLILEGGIGRGGGWYIDYRSEDLLPQGAPPK